MIISFPSSIRNLTTKSGKHKSPRDAVRDTLRPDDTTTVYHDLIVFLCYDCQSLAIYLLAPFPLRLDSGQGFFLSSSW